MGPRAGRRNGTVEHRSAMLQRVGAAVVLVAALLVGAHVLVPEDLSAAPVVPELRSRPADAVLTDGFRHLVVHADAPLAAGGGIEEVRPMGGGDYSVTTTLADDEVAALPGVAAVSHDVWSDPYTVDPDLARAWGLEND